MDNVLYPTPDNLKLITNNWRSMWKAGWKDFQQEITDLSIDFQDFTHWPDEELDYPHD